MGSEKEKHFAEKHGPDAKPNKMIQEMVAKHAKENTLACAVAFEIVKELGVSANEVGKTLDLLNVKLAKCQLGLFGYSPDKKIVKPKDEMNSELKEALQESLIEGRLPCQKAWDLASRFNVPKMNISGNCEAMGIKIKPCQLGAF
ncbi:hypothetical protein ACFL9U_07505 [Thermodesulfobacteriota bacterium]